MSDLISVIIPIYNSEKYLKKCLDSVISQTYKNLEIILINDGSLDSSGMICLEYADKDKRIKYIEKENEGQSVARNIGIDNANGKFLCFLDSDDYIDEKYLDSAIKVIKENKIDAVIFNYYHVYMDGKAFGERDFSEGIYDLKSESQRYKFLVKVFLPYKCGFEVWNRIYSADIIRKNNIRFPVFNPVVGEDLFFNILYFLCANRVQVSNDRYYYYAHNEGSTMDLNKENLHLNRYNEISQLGYNYVCDRGDLGYIKDNYAYIHVLLIYHELMSYSLRQSREQLRTIKEKAYFKGVLHISIKGVYSAVEHMGVTRGLKYTLLGIFYKMTIGK